MKRVALPDRALAARAWALSIGLHLAVIAVTITGIPKLSVMPKSDPLRWEVSLVEPVSPTPAEQTPTASVTPSHPVQADQAEPASKPVPAQVQRRPIVQAAEPLTQTVVEIARPIEQVAPVETQPVVQEQRRVERNVVLAPDRTPVKEVRESSPLQQITVAKQVEAVEQLAPIKQPVISPELSIVRQQVGESQRVVRQPERVETTSVSQKAPAQIPASSASVVSTPAPQPLMPNAIERQVAAPVETAATQPIESVNERMPIERATPEQSPPASPTSSSSAEALHTAARTEQSSPTSVQKSPPSQIASVPQGSSRTKADYGWLVQSLWKRVVAMKRYPYEARLNRWEGKVVLKAVIRADGQLGDLQILESSGHSVLDDDAMELIRRVCPLELIHALDRQEIAVQIPISYALR